MKLSDRLGAGHGWLKQTGDLVQGPDVVGDPCGHGRGPRVGVREARVRSGEVVVEEVEADGCGQVLDLACSSFRRATATTSRRNSAGNALGMLSLLPVRAILTDQESTKPGAVPGSYQQDMPDGAPSLLQTRIVNAGRKLVSLRRLKPDHLTKPLQTAGPPWLCL